MGLRFRAATTVLMLLAAGMAGGWRAFAQDSWETTINEEAALAPDPAADLKGSLPADPIETGAVQPKSVNIAIAESAHLEGDQARTIFRLGLSKGVIAEVFTLANPYRVVVDLPDVGFSLTAVRRARG